MKKLKGKTSEEQLKHVEKILEYHSRRLGKKIIEKMPAVPISNSASNIEADDYILDYLLPFDCKIDQVYIAVGERDELFPEIKLTIEIIDGDHTTIKYITLSKKQPTANIKISRDVRAGSFIFIYPDCSVKRISAAASIFPKNFTTKEHLINNLLGK